MAEIVNPYIAGAPVVEQRMFFGRDDIFQWIENSIAGQYADHILVVHGQRRVGKTSVLKQLGNRLPQRYIPVFFDLQGRTHTTLDHFLWWLARETVRVLKQERDIEVPPPQKDAFAADPEYFENQFLTSLRTLLGKDTLLLTFDEFDNLEESEVKEELARPLIDHLRRLMGQPNLNFVFSIGSSGRKLENMQAAYTDFFKTALYKKISFLNEEQTHKLVTRPVEGIIEYERAAIDRIFHITSGHPYFTQLTCHELFARCQRTEQRKIAKADVEAVLDDVVERGTVNLKFVWDEASDIEKWSLSALAQLDKTDNRAVADYLRKNRVRFSETDLTSGLLHLREKDVLTPQNRFVIHLLQIWLQKNRPIEQAREELTEANPIANRFIEIGLEFREGGQPEKAIEFFRQALSVASDNLQAQVNIALTYASQGQLEQAIAEFEKALTIDDEDVASRSGLCDAHLALGDAALQKGRTKDAVLSYQRVLEINTEHTEARGHMAEISRQRAEKALADGRDEEALSAFSDALKYTPEDEILSARMEEVWAEKKAKILASLVSRSEQEAREANWNAAVHTLEKAIALSPEDSDIQKRLSNAREEHHQQKSADLKARAQGLADAEKFDEALKTWQEYLLQNPNAEKQVEEEIARARRNQELFDLYTTAGQAIASCDFDQAIKLLKDVIYRDENYKDASHLLTKAIELRRTTSQQRQSKSSRDPEKTQQPRSRSGTKTSSKAIWITSILLAILCLGIIGGTVAVSEVVNMVSSRATEQIQLTEARNLINQQATQTKNANNQQATQTQNTINQQATQTKNANNQQATQTQNTINRQATQTQISRSINATATTISKSLTLVAGPSSGNLNHKDDNFVQTYCINVNLQDFVAEARFYNPYDAFYHTWDYGFMFRHGGFNNQYRIYITSGKKWYLTLWQESIFEDIAEGNLSNLRRGKNDFNTIKLVALGDSGYLYVNDTLISRIDLNLRLTRGGVCVATGLLNSSEVQGYKTEFKDFNIWSINPSP